MTKNIKKAGQAAVQAPAGLATTTPTATDPVGAAAQDPSLNGMQPSPGTEGATITGEPVEPQGPPADTPKARIPKANTPSEEGKGRRGQLPKAMENTDIGSDIDLQGSDITLGRQTNPQEAVAYAMTQEDPVRAIRQLNDRHQLTDTTDTYALMEENGYTMAR